MKFIGRILFVFVEAEMFERFYSEFNILKEIKDFGMSKRLCRKRNVLLKDKYHWKLIEWKRVQKRFYDNIWACNITLDVILRGNGVVLCAAILSSMAQPVGIQNLLPTRHLWVSFCSCWTSITGLLWNFDAPC